MKVLTLLWSFYTRNIPMDRWMDIGLRYINGRGLKALRFGHLPFPPNFALCITTKVSTRRERWDHETWWYHKERSLKVQAARITMVSVRRWQFENLQLPNFQGHRFIEEATLSASSIKVLCFTALDNEYKMNLRGEAHAHQFPYFLVNCYFFATSADIPKSGTQRGRPYDLDGSVSSFLLNYSIPGFRNGFKLKTSLGLKK